MIFDPTPINLRADDKPSPDLQALGIELGDLLRQADRHIAAMQDALGHRDIIEGARQAQMWGAEARTATQAAQRLHETLQKERRAIGLLSMSYSKTEVS